MKRRTPTKWTTESYVKKMLEISPTITVVGEYINMASPIECRCDVCGYKWSPSAQNLIRGTGCPECAKTAQSNRMKARKTKKTEWTQDSFIKRIYEIDPSLEILGEYKNGASAIQCRCKKCNYEWAPSANNLLNNRSHCPKCSKENAKSLTRMTHEEFVKRVADNNKSIEVIGQYKNTKSRIECRCKECGNVWFPTADSLLSGRKCRVCSYIENGPKLTKSQDDFLQALQEVNPSIEVLGDYCGVYDPIRCRCSVCNHEWDAVPHYLLTGRGCPECCHTSTSFIEQAIYNAFTNALGEKAVLSRDKTAIGKELDIYIPELKTAIEPGSWYYHCSKQSADKEKRTLCNAKGIKLFFVFYDYDGPIITDPNTLCFSESLSSKYDREKLTNLICLLFEKCSIPKSFSSKEWTEIYTNAYLQSRRITTPVFKARIKEISPNIEVLGEYFNSKSKIKCRCSTCGNIWEVTPDDLLSGKGCRECAVKRVSAQRRYSQETFVIKLNAVNPNVEVLGKYINSISKIDIKCKVCGHKWDTTPASLLAGHGCPECAKKKGSSKRTYSHNVYIKKLESTNPNIEALSEYKGSKEKIVCRCKLCNNVWSVRADSLIKTKHSGCPLCSRLKHK